MTLHAAGFGNSICQQCLSYTTLNTEMISVLNSLSSAGKVACNQQPSCFTLTANKAAAGSTGLFLMAVAEVKTDRL